MSKAGAKPITVLLVDDHPVVRDGYRRMLEAEPDIRVVAEADNGETGCAHYKTYAPDVVILDLNMPGIGGLETVRRIKAQDPEARILMFSMHDTETMVRRALEAGAMGYLTKKSDMGQMERAVRQVARGERFIEAEQAVGMALQKQSPFHGDILGILSTREFQIFKMSAEGHAIPEIADILSISPKTVGVHHANIMKKLGLKNTVQLVRLALRSNIIEP